MKQYRLTISAIRHHPNDLLELEFNSAVPISFIPGQFISLELIINGKPERRSYSLCNSPYTSSPLTIAIKKVENGAVSRFIHDNLNVGDTITAYEPAGLFQYHPQTQAPRDIVLIGAGSGITPLFSILQSALLREPQSKITLIYSNRSRETTLFYEQLEQLTQQYPQQLNVIHLWSSNKNLSFARLNKDLLSSLVQQYVQHNRDQTIVYTCGPADFMLTVKIVLTGMGFTAPQLKKETFTLPEDEADDDDETLLNERTIDTNTNTVSLKFRGQRYQLPVPYTHTILDAALEQKIDIPYSCRSGMCGTCVALCTQGEVRMQYNEVLTDRETQNGKVLLCTAHPQGNDVVVEVGT